ncbi:MAG: response regulator [Planctomycetes bacterium]|nr:response regulator [Planctomycetota bacterium]
MPRRVLLATEDHKLVDAVVPKCESYGLQVATVTGTSKDCLPPFPQWKDADTPDLLILDSDTPLFRRWAICEQFVPRNTLALLPVIVVGPQSDHAMARQCEEFGVHYVFKSDELWRDMQPLFFELLSIQPAEGQAPSPNTSPRENGDHVDLPPTVLCIDDDYAFTKMMQLRLTSFGFNVLCVSNALQGYLMALKRRPDAIITDYTMPEGYGTYLLRRLKEHTLTRTTPVIVLTGRDISGRPIDHKDFALERQLRNLGAECVLTKPVDWPQLLDVLRRCCDVHDTPLSLRG